MEGKADFPKIVVGQEVVQQTDGAIGPLPDVDPFINQVVYLLTSNFIEVQCQCKN
jgi:hypothetical protein